MIVNLRINRRRGVSELSGTLMMMAITLVAGTAVFGYVRTQANISELAYGQNVGGTLNFLQERFVIPLVSYTSNTVTVCLPFLCRTRPVKVCTPLSAAVKVYASGRSSCSSLLSNFTVPR